MRIPARHLTCVASAHTGGLLALCALDPVSGVCLAQQVGRWRSWNDGDVVALGRPARPAGAAWATGSLLPFGLAPRPGLGHDGAARRQVQALAEHAGARLTRNGSVYGPAADVAAVWPHLADCGLRSREERWVQPLLVAPQETGALIRDAVRRHPAVGWAAESLHAATLGEEELVLPASIDMFTGEVGYDPTSAGGAYARHVNWLVAARRSYIVVDDGEGHPPLPGGPRRVAFKVDVGALWNPVPGREGGVAQLTGVWTRSDLRGRGLASVALAAAIEAVRARHVGARGTVSLYVNDFNTAALGLYGRLGFERAGTFATVLL